MENIHEDNSEIPLGDSQFIREALGNFNHLCRGWERPIDVSDVVLFIASLYIQMRETISKEDLGPQIESTLYITEQTIQMYQERYPGRYPSSTEEAQLKFDIDSVFRELNNDEQT
tara:strand:+ start:5721 stop:6065 length:345 start_codon:yes stop_codon:yes gene_type:complete